MHETRAAGQGHRVQERGRRALSFVLGPLSIVVLLAGCGAGAGAGKQQLAPANNNDNDPLLGGGAPVGSGTLPPPKPAPVVPPVPGSLTSQASLAGATAVNDRNPDLRILDASGATQSGAVATSSGAGQWVSAPAGGTTLHQPEPVYDGQPRQDTMVQPVVGLTGNVRGETYEQLQSQLAARGVAWQQLQTSADHNWKFACSIPNRQNPNVSRTYEATAATDLAAIRAALDQIGKEHP